MSEVNLKRIIMKGQYLLQARNESCVMYRNINRDVKNFFTHLLYTNGNGIEFQNGNPVELVSFYRTIPWEHYYAEELKLDNIKSQYIKRYLEQDCIETQKIIQRHNFQSLWDEALIELDNIKELTLEQITDKDYWISTFTTKSYIPYLHLSQGYFKMQHINANTESTLIKVAIALSLAYVNFYEYIIQNKDKITDYKPIMSFRWADDDIDSVYNVAKSDIIMLKKEIARLNSFRVPKYNGN